MIHRHILLPHFINPETCEDLINLQTAPPNDHSENPYPYTDWTLINRIRRIIAGYYNALGLYYDYSILTTITPGGFTHIPHADNAKLVPRQIGDIGANRPWVVLPNHTPHRKYTALLYLNKPAGGDLILGEAPDPWGWHPPITIHPEPGLLVIFPSSEYYHHRTTPVRLGLRHSLNIWFK